MKIQSAKSPTYDSNELKLNQIKRTKMNLAEQLKQEQANMTANDWRAERTLQYVASKFREGRREVSMKFFGLYESFPDVECPIPDEWKRISGGQHSKIERDGERYIGVKSGAAWNMEAYVSKCDLTDTEYPYRGFTDKEDRDAKIRILEQAGFKTYTHFVYGHGDVTEIYL